ncbi:putative integrase [Pseudomonas chlororaphis]|uniref:Putative integrase n=1 Tax=Pseudomonas chlororaphis TaxID=587753 RepID=A0A3G7TMU1_9PSED|nr:putative integrase [Pseudomonas chlororaphis]
MGSKQTCTLSLKTTQRQSAVTTARHLLTTLRAFHLDNPQATWEQLKERLKDIAEGVLQTRAVWDVIAVLVENFRTGKGQTRPGISSNEQ